MRKRSSIHLLLIILLVFGLLFINSSQTKASTTITLNATEDAYIDGRTGVPDSSTQNFGNSPDLSVSGDPSYPHKALIRFDIGSIPTNANIISATLLVMPHISATHTVQLKAATTTWSEMSVTWVNKPAESDVVYDQKGIRVEYPQDLSFNAKELVNYWRSSGNYGLYLIGNGSLPGYVFFSKEGTGFYPDAYGPRLELTYSIPTPPPTPSPAPTSINGDNLTPTPVVSPTIIPTPSSDESNKINKEFLIRKNFLEVKLNKDLGDLKSEETSSAGKKICIFSGKSIPNTKIYLFIFSDPLVFSTTTNSEGKWNITVENLEAGSHEAFVALVDKDGNVTERSNPLSLTVAKTSPSPTITPTAKPKKLDTNLFLYFGLGGVAVLLAVVLIVLVVLKKKKDKGEIDNKSDTQTSQPSQQ